MSFIRSEVILQSSNVAQLPPSDNYLKKKDLACDYQNISIKFIRAGSLNICQHSKTKIWKYVLIMKDVRWGNVCRRFSSSHRRFVFHEGNHNGHNSFYTLVLSKLTIIRALVLFHQHKGILSFFNTTAHLSERVSRCHGICTINCPIHIHLIIWCQNIPNEDFLLYFLFFLPLL